MVKALSGGERNRVILAKLFTRPANLLVLDEPTNDLDIETLEVLEQKLCEYSGTLIVVSHDREFLDNVVTSTIVFEEDGRIQEYVGGYSDWLKRGHELAVRDNPYEIERLEAEIANLQRTIAVPGFYEQDTAMVQQTLRDLGDRESLLERRIDRWGELESLQESLLK